MRENRLVKQLATEPAEIKDYLEMLCQLGGCGILEETEHISYYYLFYKLYLNEYFWELPDDDIREYNVLDMRSIRFEIHENSAVGSRPVSVLEVIIELALEWNDIVQTSENCKDEVYKYVWEILDNLDLLEHYDQTWDDFSEYDVEDKIFTWLSRDYDYRGQGGIFPLKNPSGDQRIISTWYQMNEYIMENYDI